MPLFRKKNKVAPKPPPPPPSPLPPPPPIRELTPAKLKMNTALLKALMERKQKVADANAERNARAARRTQIRNNQPLARWLADQIAAREQIAKNQARILQLIANTTIDPASVPAVPDFVHPPRPLLEYKNGGKVKKTGIAKLHKGEIVIPANRVDAVQKAVKKAGLKPLKV